jgi:hypothetical protein
MADTETLPFAPETPALSESESAFDSKAAWAADSEDHDPAEAGNDTHGAGALETEASAEGVASSPADAPSPEEPPRDDKGQFVAKKGKGKPRSDPQARVEQATAKEAAAKADAQKARDEAEQLRARLSTLERQSRDGHSDYRPSVQPTPAPTTFPAFDKWLEAHPHQDWDTYNDEKIAFRAEQIARQQVEQWAQQQSLQTQVQRHQQRVAEGAAKFPDYQEVIDRANPVVFAGLTARGLNQFPAILEAAVVQSERPADIIRDLALHPEDAIQLAVEVKDYPVSAAPMLRRLLEARLTATAAARPSDSAPVAQPSAAKPPINRVGGSASATPVDPEDLDFGPDYIRLENERERKRAAMGRW